MARKRAAGEGSIFYREDKGLWCGQVTLPSGKRKTKYAKTQKEVKEWLLGQREAVRDQNWVETESLTLSAFLDRYMADVGAHTLRPKTIEAYSYLIRLHIKPELGNLRLTSLRPDHLQKLYSQKLNSGLSRRTVQFIHGVLHKSLNQALRWGLVTRNVADLVDAPTVKKKELQTFTQEQIETFLTAVRGHRWENIYLVAVGTGMREGELLGIHVSDVQMDKGIIQVRHTIQYLVGKGLVVGEPKSDKSKRAIPLPAFAIEAIKRQLEYRSAIRESAGEKWTESGMLFTTGNGTPISPRNLIRHFKEVLETVGLPEIRFHDFSRHTHATLLLQAGVHPKVVQERLGHSQISLTMDVYSHVLPSMQEEASSKINDLFPSQYDRSTLIKKDTPT